MKNNKKGFTLAELLIVIAIMAILIAIAIPVFSSQLENARHSVDESTERSAKSLAESHYLLVHSAGDAFASSIECEYEKDPDGNLYIAKCTPAAAAGGVPGAAVACPSASSFPSGGTALNKPECQCGKYTGPLKVTVSSEGKVSGGWTKTP